MNKRTLIYTATALTLLLGLMSSMLTLPARGNPLAQEDATAQAQTISAIIEQYFTQTAQAVQQVSLTQTALATQSLPLTATAAFEATLDAAFRGALTATARAAFSYHDLRVASSYEIDLIAAPGRTSAYLSPDGKRFAYLRSQELCIYTIAGLPERCTPLGDEARGLDTETLHWSPDGRCVAFTTDFLRTFRDSDIWVMEAATGRLTNLTDDGTLRADILRGEGEADIDLSPVWLNDSQRILFLRYIQRGSELSQAQIFTVSLDGKTERLGELAFNGLANYVLAVSPDNTRIAFNAFNQGEQVTNGLWIADLDGQNRRQLLRAEQPPLVPRAIQFSPDGRYLLILDAMDQVLSSAFKPEQSAVKIVPAAGGQAVPVDAERYVRLAGWSPGGSALAYLVFNPLAPDTSGLYLKPSLDEPGQMLLPGEFIGTTSMQTRLFWGADNTLIMAGRGGSPVVVVKLAPR